MNSRRRIRLGTRGSALARWQAEWVAGRLAELGVEVEMVHISTGGDVTSKPIAGLGTQGVFTKEIQRALLDDRVDLAVHSLKDLPTEPVDGLVLAAVPTREDPRDVLVSHVAGSLEDLPASVRVGTGSRRRQSQLLNLRPDLEVVDIRGNVETRLKKLDDGQYDAIVLARAGLERLGLSDRISEVLPADRLLPAVGQGALGIETRAGDEPTIELLASLNDAGAEAGALAERSMLRALRGGCLAPVGAWSRLNDDGLTLDGVVLSLDGRQRVTAQANGPLDGAEAIGQRVAEQLLAQGAGSMIAESRS